MKQHDETMMKRQMTRKDETPETMKPPHETTETTERLDETAYERTFETFPLETDSGGDVGN